MPLALFDGAHIFGGLEQRLGRARVEPGEAAAQPNDIQLAELRINAIEIGDLQLAARPSWK